MRMRRKERCYYFSAGIVTFYVMICHDTLARTVGAETVYLPCPEYTEGSAWYFEIKHPDFTLPTFTVVLSNKNNTIELAERTMIIMPDMAPQPLSLLHRLEVSGNIIYDISSNILPAAQQEAMRVPICGELPVQTFREEKSLQMTFITTAKALGRQRVTVPAGTFDAYVVEQTTSTKATMGGEEINNTATHTVYAAEKLGVVRYIIDTSVPEGSKKPEALAQKNHKSESSAMEQAEEPIRKGDGFEKRLDQAVEEALKSVPLKMVGELQRYRIK